MKEVLENLKDAVKRYDCEGAASWARKAMEKKIDPIRAFNAMTEAMKEVGDGFERDELWLPELVGADGYAADAATAVDKAKQLMGQS